MFNNLLQEIIEERDRLDLYYESEKDYIPFEYLKKIEYKIKVCNEIIDLLNKLQ